MQQGSITLRTDPGDKLIFQFNPESINVSSRAVWARQTIPGKHHPVLQYGGGEGREISFTLWMNTMISGSSEIDDMIDWLISLTYPDAGASAISTHEPPRCILYMGPRHRYFVVFESADVVYDQLDLQLNTRTASVDMVAIEDQTRSIGYREVRGGGG